VTSRRTGAPAASIRDAALRTRGSAPWPGAARGAASARLTADAVPGCSGPRWTRRRLLQRASAAAAIAGAGTLAGCAQGHARAGATPAAPTIHLLIQLNWQGASTGGITDQQVRGLADDFITRNWLPRHPGVGFTTVLGGGSHISPGLDNGPTVAAIIAGQGPDLVEVCCSGIPALEASGLLLPLDRLVKQDNLDLSIFPAGVMTGLTTDQGLVGLPNAGQTEPLFVNLSLLDELGLAYPDPDWDSAAAAKLWQAVARKQGGTAIYGCDLNLAGTMMGWLVEGFGGHVYNQDHTVCTLDAPQCVQAFEWLMPLIWNGAVVPRQTLQPIPTMAKGQLACATACCGALGQAVVSFGTNFNWDLVPMPSFPVAKANGIFHALYGISTASRAPQDLLWDLLKFICVEKDWQIFWNAQLALASPNQITPSLWEEWEAIVRAAAPLTAHKHIEYFADAAKSGQGWTFAKLQADQASAIETQYYGQMQQRRLTVQAALTQAAAQINALEQAAAAEAAKARSEAAQFPTSGPAIAGTPPGV
jgi:ABC-type glycerol-3-phosphate transport system substrate-binding protein